MVNITYTLFDIYYGYFDCLNFLAMTTRGLRNNNPFNIILTNDRWRGQIKSTDRFVRFRSLDYGIRAGIQLIRTYISKGYDTPRKIITRFAPPIENDTLAYISYVDSVVSTGVDDKIFLSSLQFYELIKAICWYESNYDLDYDYYISICRRFRIL